MTGETTTQPAGSVSTSVLTRRMLTALLGAVPAFVLARQAVIIVVGDEILGIVAGAATALAVAAVLLARTVSPLVAQQAALEERYEAALADALTDPLTGLGNHRAFHEELDRQVAASQRYGTPLSLALIDLDEFKQINDKSGHAAGDRMLRGFAHILNSATRRADRPFRIGGDEFAVILPHTDLAGAHIVTRRILAQSLGPSLRSEDVSPVSFSAGVSSMPEMATDRSRLFNQADVALYAAKRGGRTDVVAFDPSLEASDKDDEPSTAAAAIADVISRGLLRPVYQPIVALASREVIGVEGLIRPVEPAPFSDPAGLFAAAEAGGRLVALDLACVETIVRGAADLPANQFLSVNLSPATLEAPEFSPAAFLSILARNGFPADRLVVEITEHQALREPARVRERLEACRAAGVRFAADDIGAGNAGLRLLSEISFEVLKVDLGLVQASAAGGPSSAVIGSMVGFATRIGAFVIAEGIEHAEQIDQLLELGIEAGQGYHLGHPGPIVPEMAPQAPMETSDTGMSAWRQSIGLPAA
ncbi:MAG TPA: bifunctional diguanylate cyclase/phosphodiesterase [Candidatus Limnocylindria bacterium]|nr:bifunctional diguanylate cyclase/phosphodiesterase [Candidatus Limnocylindria bacterium]